MKLIKKKLSSNSGASMLLALVFLMFCLFVGGSVLSAATANGSRAARQKEDQQAYLSQRSASLLLADLLKGDKDSAMQLTIKDVQQGDSRKITFMIHEDSEKSALQRMLYDFAVRKYAAEKGLDLSKGNYVYVNFNFEEVTGVGYMPSNPAENGAISMELREDGKVTDTINANYTASGYGDFELDYAVKVSDNEQGATPEIQTSYVKLTMACYDAVGKPVTVNGVTTTTSIIRWDNPVVEKGGA